MHPVKVVLGALMLMAWGGAVAQEPAQEGLNHPDAGRGEVIARQWCSGCHVIGGANSGTDAAPTFLSIARNPNDDPDHLRGFLSQPHPPMPPISLNRMEIEDVIAYFQQLANRK